MSQRRTQRAPQQGKKKVPSRSRVRDVSPAERPNTVGDVRDIPGSTSDFACLTAVSPAEAAPVDLPLHVWSPVPGLATAIASNIGDSLEITVSAEVYQSGGAVWMRALLDGRVVHPSDVQFKAGSTEFDGVRSFTFVEQVVATQGQHLVEIQMRSNTAVRIRDRSLTVLSTSAFNGSSLLFVGAASSGPSIKAPTNWQDIPGLSRSAYVTVPSSLAMTLSAEAWANSGRLLVRALVNGAATGEVTFVEAGNAQRSGTRSYTFVVPSIPAGPATVRLQWRAANGSCWIGDRTISVSAAYAGTQRVIAAAHEPALAVSQTSWVDITGSAIIETRDSVSVVMVTASTEVLSSRGRVFLRVLLDGAPAVPGDVTLIQGGSRRRATSHTFIIKNVPRGRHRVRVQGRVDPQTTGKFGPTTVRVFWKRRRGADWVQPFLGMTPRMRRLRMLVVGFDPVRPEHPVPAFERVRNTFEGAPQVIDEGPFGPVATDPGRNLRGWLQENSGGIATLGAVRYVGCHDGQWFKAPVGRQGNWYWEGDAGAPRWDQMHRDGLAAADPVVDFHAFDADRSNQISPDELVVAIVKPQNQPYGTLRYPEASLDGITTQLQVPILDLYISANPDRHEQGVATAAHEFSHLVCGALDLYGNCRAISAGRLNIMDYGYAPTHLDPFEKMKNGWVQPWDVDLDTLTTVEWNLGAVESGRSILLLHDSLHVAREYFLIENRYPGPSTNRNYDAAIGNGVVVIWQIFEDPSLVQNAAICPGDPRFIRKLATLADPDATIDLAWADGSPAGCRVSAPVVNAAVARVRLEKT